MKKKMERIADELFRPLTLAEQRRVGGGDDTVTTTTAITLLETQDPSPDYTRDGDINE
jgi:hypothetical protein